ncbi:hypothetical protein D3C75_1210150 [compost metagenome]
MIASALIQDEQVEHAQQDGCPVKHPDQGIPHPDGLAAFHRFLHDFFPLVVMHTGFPYACCRSAVARIMEVLS